MPAHKHQRITKCAQSQNLQASSTTIYTCRAPGCLSVCSEHDFACNANAEWIQPKCFAGFCQLRPRGALRLNSHAYFSSNSPPYLIFPSHGSGPAVLPLTSQRTSSRMESIYSCSSLTGLVSSNLIFVTPPNSLATPKLRLMLLACPAHGMSLTRGCVLLNGIAHSAYCSRHALLLDQAPPLSSTSTQSRTHTRTNETQ